jgi:hypothetical protein
MTSRDFCYWLQGLFELTDADRDGINPAQAEIIKRHLALVFKHEIDPSAGDEKTQEELNAIHSGVPMPPSGTPSGEHKPPSGTLYRC